MFRLLFLILFVAALCSPVYGQFVTNYVIVVNDTTAPIPVVVSAPDDVNYYPAFLTGTGIAFGVCGFAWILKLARKTGGYSE